MPDQLVGARPRDAGDVRWRRACSSAPKVPDVDDVPWVAGVGGGARVGLGPALQQARPANSTSAWPPAASVPTARRVGTRTRSWRSVARAAGRLGHGRTVAPGGWLPHRELTGAGHAAPHSDHLLVPTRPGSACCRAGGRAVRRYRAVLAAVNALGANQRDQAERLGARRDARLGTVETRLTKVESTPDDHEHPTVRSLGGHQRDQGTPDRASSWNGNFRPGAGRRDPGEQRLNDRTTRIRRHRCSCTRSTAKPVVRRATAVSRLPSGSRSEAPPRLAGVPCQRTRRACPRADVLGTNSTCPPGASTPRRRANRRGAPEVGRHRQRHGRATVGEHQRADDVSTGDAAVGIERHVRFQPAPAPFSRRGATLPTPACRSRAPSARPGLARVIAVTPPGYSFRFSRCPGAGTDLPGSPSARGGQGFGAGPGMPERSPSARPGS